MPEGTLGGLAGDDGAYQFVLARQRDVGEDDGGIDAGAGGIVASTSLAWVPSRSERSQTGTSLSALGAVIGSVCTLRRRIRGWRPAEWPACVSFRRPVA
jgi:hypothetical protein